MPAPVIDLTIPLNIYRLDLVARNGYTEAVCQSCNAWVRISKHYMGDTLVLRAVAHNYPCANYEAFIKEYNSNSECVNMGQLINRNL